MDKNEKTALKTSKSEFGKRYTVFQIFLNAWNGNKNLNSELFLSKKQNNIQASSEKEFNISKKEKKVVFILYKHCKFKLCFSLGNFCR